MMTSRDILNEEEQVIMRRIQWFIILLLCSLQIAPAIAQQNTVEIPEEPIIWDGIAPMNILVLGMDRRPGARDNLNVRTDVIMVVRFDPATGTLGILDIPRDMHMAILDADEQLIRVNTLMVRGESRAEGYGPYFAIETLQLNFGMYIDAYIAFDFEAFITFIDAIGGVTVNVPARIYDPYYPNMNYGYDPLFIQRGINHFDGRTALAYARTRHADNDYVRGQRQLQVVLAVYERLKDPEALQSLIQNVPSLIQKMDGHLYSNIDSGDLVRLGLAMTRLNAQEVRTASLNQEYSFGYIFQGRGVRVPDRERLPELLTGVFGEDYWR